MLLGGLLGGLGRRAIGGGGRGLLGGLLSRRGGSGGGMRQQSAESESSGGWGGYEEDEKQPVKEGPQEAPPKPQQTVETQPAQEPALNNTAEGIAQPVKDAAEKPQQPVTAGLLDDTPPAQQPVAQDTTEGQEAVRSVVNESKELAPVAMTSAAEQFGQTPQMQPTEMADQIGIEPPKKLPRTKVQYVEANPSKKPDMPKQEYTSDYGYSFTGASSPTDIYSPPRYS